MELIFNPCGEFRWSSKGPFSQIHSPHLHARGPGIFSNLLRIVQMLKRQWGAGSNGKLPHLGIPSKTGTFVSEFSVEDLPFRQNCSLGVWICSERPALGQSTLMMRSLWCLIYPCWFSNLQWLRPAGLYERCQLALVLKRLKTPALKCANIELLSKIRKWILALLCNWVWPRFLVLTSGG